MDETLYCPVPYTYVVAQLDIQATVQNLDMQAQEASRTIKPAKCILYLYDSPRFPLPGIPTPFETYIVGPSLRAEDPENCLSTDMCVPIFPNTTHPNDRPPVRTKTPFPLSNCYHWTYVDVLVRVSSGEFPSLDDPRLVRLAGSQQARLDRFLTDDLNAAVLAKKRRQETSPRPDYDPEYDVFCRKSRVPEELQPVVTVSVDLAASLEEENLPDPMEFLRQYNALVRLAKESAARRAAMEDHDSGYDDGLSVSTAYTDNDQSSWMDGHEFGEMRSPGKFQRVSDAVMRVLRIRHGEKRDTDPHREFHDDENPSLSSLFDELSEIIVEPKPKDFNKFRRMFRAIRGFFRLRQARG